MGIILIILPTFGRTARFASFAVATKCVCAGRKGGPAAAAAGGGLERSGTGKQQEEEAAGSGVQLVSAQEALYNGAAGEALGRASELRQLSGD